MTRSPSVGTSGSRERSAAAGPVEYEPGYQKGEEWESDIPRATVLAILGDSVSKSGALSSLDEEVIAESLTDYRNHACR